MPLQRRLPKFGFTNPFRLVYEEVTVTDLGLLPAGSIVDAVALRGARLIRGKGDGVVVLGKGDVAGAYTVRVDRVTAGAREAIEKAGGKVDLVPPRQTMHEKRKSEKKARAKA
jgi:large subunit ribosomal protein L15